MSNEGTLEREPTGKHLFDQECAEHSIEHRLIKPRKPQTNGMAERFNGRIKEIIQQTRFESAQQLEETLIRYLDIYNSNIPQGNLGHVTSMEAWRKTHPDLFEKSESNHPGLDSYGNLFWERNSSTASSSRASSTGKANSSR